VAADLEAHVPGLTGVSHLHAWSITQERRLATLEAAVAREADPFTVKDAIKERLRDRHKIGHATVETLKAAEPAALRDGSAS
jgi:cobalt-zinc-cadmium efflux system protein